MKNLISVIVMLVMLLGCGRDTELLTPKIDQEQSALPLDCVEDDIRSSDFVYSQFPSYGTKFKTGFQYVFKIKYQPSAFVCPEDQQYVSLLIWTPAPQTCEEMPNWVEINGQKFYPEPYSYCSEDFLSASYDMPVYAWQLNNPNYEFTFTVKISAPRSLCLPLWMVSAAVRDNPNAWGNIYKIEGGGTYDDSTYKIKGITAFGC